MRKGEKNLSSRISTRRIAIRLAVGIAVLLAAFFGSAGTLAWPEAWLYIIIQYSFFTMLTIWLKKHNPELLRDRMAFLKPATKRWDKAILLISTVVFVPYLILPGLDAVRFQWSIVEAQKERGHRVITTSPYQYVRHPMYFGVIVVFNSIAVALGSLWSLIPIAVLTLLILIRTYLEDKTLHEELQGYNSYAERVRYKIFPGIW